MKKFSTLFLSLRLIGFPIFAQTTTAPATTPTGPSYSSTTGIRYSYYDKTITETTNFSVRVTSATLPAGTLGTVAPQGLWAVMSVDATPRSQSSSAGLRFGAKYFLKSTAGGNIIFHVNAQGGAVTAPAATTTTALSVSSLLANFQGGGGFTARICHAVNKKTSVNCVLDVEYDLNAVSSQAVKPLIGIFAGVAF